MKITKLQRAGAIVAGISTLLMVPTALAAQNDWPVVGQFDWISMGGLLVILGIIGALGALAFTKPLARRIPVLGTWAARGTTGAAIFTFAILAAAAINTGGWLNGEAASFGMGDSDDDGIVYEPTADITFYAADKASKSTSIAPVVKVFPSGTAVTEKSAFEGSATPDYTVTLSSGTGTLSGYQAQTLGCTLDMYLDLTGYYQEIFRNKNVCMAKNALGNNDVSVPTTYIKNFGTASLATSDTSLTCTAGTQCSYSFIFRNTEANSYIKSPAINYTNVDSATLDSVEAGQNCELVNVNSVKYVVFTGDQEEVGPLGTVTCVVKITRTAGDTDGSFYAYADDLFRAYGADAWNTNSNVRGAAVTSQLTVTFA